MKPFGNYQPNSAHVDPQQSYSMIQWVNGKPHYAPLGGIAYTGGLFIAHLPAALSEMPEPWVPTRLQFQRSADAVEDGWGTQGATMAVLGHRMHWRLRSDPDRRWFTAYDARIGPMVSRVQLLIALRGLEEEQPFVLTLTGKLVTNNIIQMTNPDSLAVRLRNHVLRPARANSGLAYPGYCFWVRLVAENDGKRPVFVKEGDSQQVTRPTTPDLASPLNAEALKRAYVGDVNAARFEAWVEQAQPWLRGEDLTNLIRNTAPLEEEDEAA